MCNDASFGSPTVVGWLGGLKAFAPLKERCTILQDGEHRYEVEMPPWEGKEYVKALPPGTPWKRLCVVNVRTNERRFDVSSCRSPRPLPLLCASTDEGGGNMPMVQCMQGDLHLRLLWFRDPSHRYAHDWKMLQSTQTCGHVFMRDCIA